MTNAEANQSPITIKETNQLPQQPLQTENLQEVWSLNAGKQLKLPDIKMTKINLNNLEINPDAAITEPDDRLNRESHLSFVESS